MTLYTWAMRQEIEEAMTRLADVLLSLVDHVAKLEESKERQVADAFTPPDPFSHKV